MVPFPDSLLNGRHSLSMEQSMYDQAAMKMIRKAKSSNRETNCHCFDPISGVTDLVRVMRGEAGYF